MVSTQGLLPENLIVVGDNWEAYLLESCYNLTSWFQKSSFYFRNKAVKNFFLKVFEDFLYF